MEVGEIITRLSVQAIRAKLELCRIVAAALTRRLELPGCTEEERRVDSSRWLEVTRDGEALELALERQRRHLRNARPEEESPTKSTI